MQINIKRKPNFYYDILTLLKLLNILKNKKDLVISISPKAFLVSLCRFMFVV